MPDPLDSPDPAEPTGTTPTARSNRDMLSSGIFVDRNSRCAHITVHGFANASDTQRKNTTEVVHTSLQKLRTERDVTLALITPGNCSLPACTLDYAGGLTGTTALIVDNQPEPTSALVSNAFGCYRFTSDENPDATADTWACTAVIMVSFDKDLKEFWWAARPGVLARYSELHPTDAFLCAHEDDLRSSLSSLSERPSGARGNAMAIPWEHYETGRWAYGQITWSEIVRNKLPANVEDPLWASLNQHSRTGQPRTLWRLWSVTAGGAMVETRNLENPTGDSDDGSMVGVGWLWK